MPRAPARSRADRPGVSRPSPRRARAPAPPAFLARAALHKKAAHAAPAAKPVDFAKVAAAAAPAFLAAPAFAQEAASNAVAQLPTELLSLEVTFTAYLATLLGTFVPVVFLITLYIQSESLKAGQDMD